MIRWSQRVKLWVFSFLAVCVLLVVSALLHPTVSVGSTRVACRFTGGWSISSGSSRITEWEDTEGIIPPLPPCQFHQVRWEQFGPFHMMTDRRVPPRAGEVCK